MINWLNAVLSAVNWWVKLIIVGVTSFLATLLPLPIPIADIALGGTIGHFDSILWLVFLVVFITTLDVVFGVITYKISHKLSGLLLRSDKRKKQVEKMRVRLKDNKWADAWIFLASATPIPWTLTIYAASVVEYSTKKFVIVATLGRFVKYAIVSVIFYFGLKWIL